jgi:hypothetical protein
MVRPMAHEQNWERMVRVGWISTLALAVILFGCAARESLPGAGDSPAELSTDELLVGIGSAAGSGDLVAAKRLAELAKGRDKAARQAAMLMLLTANLAGPTGHTSSTPAREASPAWGASHIRVRRPVPDSQIGTAGYDSLPFFHGYREAASCCQHALFDLGVLTVTTTSAPPPDDNRPSEADRVVEFNFGEFLRRIGVDPRRSVYHGDTRVVDSRMLHRYEDVTGGALIGVTERVSGEVRTTMLRHSE